MQADKSGHTPKGERERRPVIPAQREQLLQRYARPGSFLKEPDFFFERSMPRVIAEVTAANGMFQGLHRISRGIGEQRK